MSDIYTILVPRILSASFSGNPANMNTQTVLSVTVAEETIYLEPTYYHSGEIYSGEV